MRTKRKGKKKQQWVSLGGLPFRHLNKSELFCCSLCSSLPCEARRQPLESETEPAVLLLGCSTKNQVLLWLRHCLELREAVAVWTLGTVCASFWQLVLDAPQVETWTVAAGCGSVREAETLRWAAGYTAFITADQHAQPATHMILICNAFLYLA